MRVLLTGATGRLGGAFVDLWGVRDDCEIVCMTRSDADMSCPEEVGAFLWDQDFDVLVNPAAMSGLEDCLDQPEVAWAVNAGSPGVMAEVCRGKGAHMVHFSTDYVFSGCDEARKTEGDPAGAVNVYGRTKQEGEREVLGACPDALVCRVSWLFGPTSLSRPSHFDNVLKRALADEEQHLIADKYSVPTFTHDVVEWVGILLGRNASGVYHLCNSGGPESWYSYAEKVCKLARRRGYEIGDLRLVKTLLSDAHFFRDPRPVHTAMLPERLQKEALVSPRHWLEAAEVYLKIR